MSLIGSRVERVNRVLISARHGVDGVAAQNSVVVQVTFTVEEVQLLKDLARGREVDEWVSEQDGLSSYWINLMRLCGVDLKEAIHSINVCILSFLTPRLCLTINEQYRSHCKGHPAFPPTLPTLCANVSQMHAVVLPSTSTLSLRPVALRIRRDLETMKHDADSTLEWLSARAFRMQQVNDQGKMQVLVPGEGECFINSNWRSVSVSNPVNMLTDLSLHLSHLSHLSI